jgi:hypothetical protein
MPPSSVSKSKLKINEPSEKRFAASLLLGGLMDPEY